MASNKEIALGKKIAELQECLRQKNLALDAMAWVWCDGGCVGGVFRYTKKELTEEVVKRAEANVTRMRRWYENSFFRAQYNKLNDVDKERYWGYVQKSQEILKGISNDTQ